MDKAIAIAFFEEFFVCAAMSNADKWHVLSVNETEKVKFAMAAGRMPNVFAIYGSYIDFNKVLDNECPTRNIPLYLTFPKNADLILRNKIIHHFSDYTFFQFEDVFENEEFTQNSSSENYKKICENLYSRLYLNGEKVLTIEKNISKMENTNIIPEKLEKIDNNIIPEKTETPKNNKISENIENILNKNSLSHTESNFVDGKNEFITSLTLEKEAEAKEKQNQQEGSKFFSYFSREKLILLIFISIFVFAVDWTNSITDFLKGFPVKAVAVFVVIFSSVLMLFSFLDSKFED